MRRPDRLAILETWRSWRALEVALRRTQRRKARRARWAGNSTLRVGGWGASAHSLTLERDWVYGRTACGGFDFPDQFLVALGAGEAQAEPAGGGGDSDAVGAHLGKVMRNALRHGDEYGK